MAKRQVRKVYSNPSDETSGTRYYSSPDAASDLIETKLITRRSGQKVIKRKGEKRRKVDSFYEDSPLNLTDFSTRQENKAKRLRKQADKALEKGKIAKYKNKATKAAIAGALSGDYYMDEPAPSKKDKVEINRIKSDVKDYASQMLNEGVKYNYKNKRQERKDLNRNAAAMMKIKNPQKKY